MVLVGLSIEEADSEIEGRFIGKAVGETVGLIVGEADGEMVRPFVGKAVGENLDSLLERPMET